jgi:hypothetical protein
MIDLYNYSLLTIFLAGLALVAASIEIGRFVGVRVGKQGGDNASTLEAAVLGLLALMIGFTFAMALSRFEARRDAVLNEANAIGATALRARLLREPHRTEVLKLLREYVHTSRYHTATRVSKRAEGRYRPIKRSSGSAVATG